MHDDPCPESLCTNGAEHYPLLAAALDGPAGVG